MTNARQTIEYCVLHDTTRTAEQKLELIKAYIGELTPKLKQGNFSVKRRDEGHWDICSEYGREWRIRGEHGAVQVCDERKDDKGELLLDRYPGWLKFPSVSSAMAFICGHYMMEY